MKKTTNSGADVFGQFIATLLVIPMLVVVCWNYGLTEVIERLGGPDANVSLIEGMLAVYCIGMLKGRTNL